MDLRIYGDRLILVGIIELERYVAGVVAAELLRWPVESLKAMAVAARSYTLWRMGRTKSPTTLTADVSGQVFRGLSRVPQPVLKATRRPRVNCSCSKESRSPPTITPAPLGRPRRRRRCGGGRAVSSIGREPDLACNRINWRGAVHVNQAGKKLGVGSVRKVRVTGFTPSNRVEEVEVKGTTATRLFSGQDLRRGWGGRSFEARTFCRDSGASTRTDRAWKQAWCRDESVGRTGSPSVERATERSSHIIIQALSCASARRKWRQRSRA